MGIHCAWWFAVKVFGDWFVLVGAFKIYRFVHFWDEVDTTEILVTNLCCFCMFIWNWPLCLNVTSPSKRRQSSLSSFHFARDEYIIAMVTWCFWLGLRGHIIYFIVGVKDVPNALNLHIVARPSCHVLMVYTMMVDATVCYTVITSIKRRPSVCDPGYAIHGVLIQKNVWKMRLYL